MLRSLFAPFAVAALALTCVGGARAATFPAPPPVPSPQPTTDVYFGTSVTDPYRYFEEHEGPGRGELL